MISRRSFLKIMGAGAAAAGAGFGTGKLFNGYDQSKSFSVHGFLPADEKLISEAVTAFVKRTGNGSQPVIMAEAKLKDIIASAYSSAGVNNSFMSPGSSRFQIHKISSRVKGDILISDNNRAVYDPAEDFTGSFLSLRGKLQNREAEFFFSAEYSESSFLRGLINGNSRNVVIENEKGVFDRIALNTEYKSINVAGPQGTTVLRIENSSVHVHSASCRHNLCKQSGAASRTGDIIACAPNKVIVKIETA